MNKRTRRDLFLGLAFITPNILGFLAFTVIPLTLSLALAFTNWDVRLHNMFKNEDLQFIGFSNFVRLFSEPDFLKYFGNTLFFMIGMPFGIAGSLCAALLLTRDLRGGSRRVWHLLITGAVLVLAILLLVTAGAGATAMTILVCGLAGLILVSGTVGRTTLYRTLFYAPHFTAGVATFILWKKLYSPQAGPINRLLRLVLTPMTSLVRAIPEDLLQSGIWLAALLMMALVLLGVHKMYRSWQDGMFGWLGIVIGGVFLLLPSCIAPSWFTVSACGTGLAVVSVVAVLLGIGAGLHSPRAFSCQADKGLGHALMLGLGLMIGQFILLGLGDVVHALPSMAAAQDGLVPPEWLVDYDWAKPALMIMGFWAAIGSNNMLLYIAGLTNIPVELYEAADIDGVNLRQRFWNVTWPQLAPVTFFIVIMSIIYGFQGGFEMARTMTQGGPAGATTTLSYFIYTEGFETGRLGYASAISWALFALVFVVTMFNWKFGNRYVND